MSGRQQSASREVRGLTRRPVSVVPCFSGCLSLCLFKSAATWAKYWITFLVLSVLPAPLSPLLCRNDWLFPQLYIMYINANDIFPINWEPFFSLSACSSTLNVCSSPLSTCSHTPSTRSHALSTRSSTPSTCIILSVPAVVHPLPAVILSVPAVVYPVPAVILPVPAVAHPLPQSSLSTCSHHSVTAEVPLVPTLSIFCSFNHRVNHKTCCAVIYLSEKQCSFCIHSH